MSENWIPLGYYPMHIIGSTESTKNKENYFLYIFDQCLVYMIPGFFLNDDSYSNQCNELYDLMLCCRRINKSLSVSFIKRGKFSLHQVKDWKNNRLEAVNHIIVSQGQPCTSEWLFDLSSKLPNLISLSLPRYFNLPFKQKDLPKRLTELKFGDHFNQRFDDDRSIFPESLTKLTFGLWFDQPLMEGVFPTLTTIEPNNVFPSSLTKLTFGAHFNHPIHKQNLCLLPPNLIKLKFAQSFDQPLIIGQGYGLPVSLRHLSIDQKYTWRYRGDIEAIRDIGVVVRYSTY